MGILVKLKNIYDSVRSFLQLEAGVVAVIYGLALLPIFGMLGLSIDAGRVYYVHSILTGASDAAALAGASAGGTADNMRRQATAIFNANIPNNFIATVAGPTIVLSSNNTVVNVSATGTINTTFMQILGQSNIAASATSQVQVTTTGAEVVLALDNTGSMAGAPMAGEISAAQLLVNTLYGSATNDTVNGLWVGVVPYSTTVNISTTGGSNWLTTLGKAQIANTKLYPNIAPTSTSMGGRWMGCVEARTPNSYTANGYTNYTNGMDATDTPPTSDSTKFTPYLYPSTMVHGYVFGQPLNRGTTSTSTSALSAPPWGSTGSTRGDNDWTLTGTVPSGSGLYFGDNYNWHGGDGNTGVGPNLGCPVPLLPLTASQTTVQSTISNMKATFRGGTMIDVGLATAWLMLSPRMQGLWPGIPSTLPQAYGKTLKVVVLMTDGQNQWYDWPGGVPGQPDTSHNYATDADYTGYGRLSEGRAGTTNPSQITTNLNTRMATMCTNLKNNGVVIYTILFNHDGSAGSSANQALFQNCATDSTKYFLTITNAQLTAAFSNIGQSISQLRLQWPGKP